MAFLDLVDRSGRIQLRRASTSSAPERMQVLLDLDLGDLIGVDGTVFNSRRGELSLRLTGYSCSPSRCGRRPTSTTVSLTWRRAFATVRPT